MLVYLEECLIKFGQLVSGLIGVEGSGVLRHARDLSDMRRVPPISHMARSLDVPSSSSELVDCPLLSWPLRLVVGG